jgi:two-component system capsular synthesis sensor histidine kinase RcsC
MAAPRRRRRESAGGVTSTAKELAVRAKESAMRILLVDDNALNVELFTDVLEADGHEIVVERDGVAGRDRALAGTFGLVILDIQLPRMDGHEICRALRAAGITVPIVALTSSAMPDQVRRGTEAGFDAYLTKPISPQALRNAVRGYGSGAPA